MSFAAVPGCHIPTLGASAFTMELSKNSTLPRLEIPIQCRNTIARFCHLWLDSNAIPSKIHHATTLITVLIMAIFLTVQSISKINSTATTTTQTMQSMPVSKHHGIEEGE
uniref:Uncharacterized protein n=1 Tax=Photinus pyralis TaxID=7054 RepID=A0A1Y1MRT2_PHOPY